jgi:chromosome partitioning protein
LKFYARKTVAGLLGIEDRNVAQIADDSGTVVKRSEVGPKARQYSLENVFDMAAFLRKKRLVNKLPMRVITTNIPRGGTGKTLLATNLAVSFALMGIKTCLIDVDYQASATMLMGYDPDVNREDALSRVEPDDILGRKAAIEKAIDFHLGNLIGLNQSKVESFDSVAKKPYGVNGPTLIPSDVSLTSLDNQLFVERMNRTDSDLTLRRWMQKCPEMQEFEAVIFDSGPGFNRVITSALAASHMVIAPVGLERVSDKGLRILSGTLESLKESLPGVVAQMRIVANQMVNTKRTIQEFKHVVSQYPNIVIPYTIQRSEDIPKSYSGQSPNSELLPFMLEYPSSEVAQSLRDVSNTVFNELWKDPK